MLYAYSSSVRTSYLIQLILTIIGNQKILIIGKLSRLTQRCASSSAESILYPEKSNGSDDNAARLIYEKRLLVLHRVLLGRTRCPTVGNNIPSSGSIQLARL